MRHGVERALECLLHVKSRQITPVVFGGGGGGGVCVCEGGVSIEGTWRLKWERGEAGPVGAEGIANLLHKLEQALLIGKGMILKPWHQDFASKVFFSSYLVEDGSDKRGDGDHDKLRNRRSGVAHVNVSHLKARLKDQEK